jgi:hypothetical protein
MGGLNEQVCCSARHIQVDLLAGRWRAGINLHTSGALKTWLVEVRSLNNDPRKRLLAIGQSSSNAANNGVFNASTTSRILACATCRSVLSSNEGEPQ